MLLKMFDILSVAKRRTYIDQSGQTNRQVIALKRLTDNGY